MNASAEKPVSRFEEWVDSPRSRLDDQLSKRRGWVLGTGYILTLVSGVLLMLMRQIDAVLLQMRPPGARGGGLSFPVTIGDLTGRYSLSGPWTAGDPAVTADTVVPPATLIVQLLVLDVLYALCSTGVLLVCYAVAWRLVRWYRSPSSAYLDGARSLLLAIGLVMIVVRFVVDVLEVVALFVAHCWGWGPAQVFGPWLTLATLVTAGIVAVPLAVAGVTILTGNGKLRASLAASRGVLVVLGAAIGLLLVLPIGSEQIDDVVRAWTPVNAVAAAVATVLAAGVVVGAVRQLTTGTPENLDPDTGDSPNTRLLVLVVVVGLSGVDLVLGGLGWGLLVPAGLLFIIWLLSRHTPARPADHPKRHHKTGTTDTTDSKLGRRVARLLGAGVCLVVLWVLIRAAAFDLFVRAEPLRPGWASLVLGVAVVLAAAGAAILFWRRRNTERLVTRLRLRRTSYPRPSWVYVAIRPWVVLTALAAGALWITWLLPWQWFAVGGPMGVGTLAVMMTGVAAAAGGAGLLVLCVRKSSCTDYTLPTALRALGFKRFPAVALILVWALIVAMFDPAGFHNARRRQVMPFTAPPSLEQAYDAWLAAGPAVSAHPLVLVAAEGGGIRAAVWTALVMECVFGPGPVKVTGSDPTKTVDPVCAEGSSFDAKAAGDEVRANRLPVFLASGASGGSVGLAAWSARRVDLAENEEGVPTDIDDLLKSDYVASDLGRLLTGDTLHQLLAQPGPDDRAGILERSWESSWGGTSGGLSRGLRHLGKPPTGRLTSGAYQFWRSTAARSRTAAGSSPAPSTSLCPVPRPDRALRSPVTTIIRTLRRANLRPPPVRRSTRCRRPRS